MSKYYINYEFGMHHVTIEVNRNEFYKVIDNLSEEFTIFKKNYLDSDENKNFDDDKKNYKITKTEYLIQDYLNNMVIIGHERR